MIRILAALLFVITPLRADDPPASAEQLEKQIAELQAKLNALKGGKMPLTIAEAATWRSIRQAALSNDGQWFAYRVGPIEGESEFVLRSGADGKETRFPGGGGGLMQFSFDSKWLAFTVSPYVKPGTPPVTGATAPKPKVVLVKLGKNEKTEFEAMSSFQFNGEAATHIAFRKAGESVEGPPPPNAPSGRDLLLRELYSGNEMLYGNVAEASFNKKGQWLVMLIDAAGQAGNGVHLRDMKSGQISVLDSGKVNYKSLAWHEDGAAFALLKAHENKDYEAKWHTVFGVTNVGAETAKSEYDPKDDKDFPADMGISANRGASWNHTLDALTFGIAEQKKKDASKPEEKKEAAPTPKPEEKKDGPKRGVGPRGPGLPTPASTTAESGKPDLVIWHWKDERLQPMQQVQATFDKALTYLSLYRVKEKKFLRLADEKCRNVTLLRNGKHAVGTDSSPYQYMSNLDGRRFSDVYVIDTVTGKKTKALEKVRYFNGASPTGEHLLFHKDGDFCVYALANGETTNLTKPITETKFVDLDDDHNVTDPPTRVVGWSRDAKFLLADDGWDIWKISISGGGVNLTVNGKAEGVRYTGFSQFDPDRTEPGFDLNKPGFTHTYGEWTKKEGYARLDPKEPGTQDLQWTDANFGPLMKARNADVFAFTKETALECPDYYLTSAEMKSLTRATDANPQQKNYLWCAGTKLVDYKGAESRKLQGAIYLPANYEKGKKYPTIVYIYEKLSDRIHNYNMPSNMGFNIAIYTSNGYAVFTPDLTYRLNDPGVSAVECMIPALDAAIATGIVDGEKLGLQGHSWGGYQTAFLVTQTNRFKAAVAGAPLTDLISMYSSVYWNSGSANQPIFESSQGRFTGGYWEQQDAYLRNSPVFHATKVQTPLVILHNDKDGAVDFTQGIEYYNTLRRLQKPVVMLQYKGENHGLVKQENRKDYSVRMREFFDHYLQGKPAPDWWTDGVPHLKLDDHLKKRK